MIQQEYSQGGRKPKNIFIKPALRARTSYSKNSLLEIKKKIKKNEIL